MDNERKKSRFIRLFGKLGGKVKFLRKPLMVIMVVCVSIHHLIRQLFFDVKYHTVRMRALMGAMCLALLCTLFVIPAIADEVLEVGTIVEEIPEASQPTDEPTPETPIIENEEPEEPEANQPAPEDTNDDDNDDSQANANQPADPSNDTNTNDGTTYEEDENGNLIDPATGESVKNDGIAARRLSVPAQPAAPTSVVVTFEGNTQMFANTASGTLKAKAKMDSSVTSGSVEFEWYIRKDSGTLEKLTTGTTIMSDIVSETDGYYASTALDVTKIINHTSPVDTTATVGYTGAGTYKFLCKARVAGKGGFPPSDWEQSDESTSITIDKFVINITDVTIPSEISDKEDLHVTVGGIMLKEPELDSNLSKYATALRGKWIYSLEKDGNYADYTAGQEAKLAPGYYTIYLKLSAAATECQLDADSNGRMAINKYFRVNYYGDVSSDGIKHCTHTRPSDPTAYIKYTPANPSTSAWYNSLKVEPANGYKFVTEKGVDAAISSSQSVEMDHNQTKTLYVAKDGKEIIDEVIVTDSFQIDKKPSGTATKGAPLVTSIDFDGLPSVNTWTNKDIEFTIKAKDKDPGSSDDFGKSGLAKIEWKAAKVGLTEEGVAAEQFASARADLGNGSKDYDGSDEDSGWNNTLTINKAATDAYAVVIYVKVTDKAGNEGFKKKKFDLVDVKAPVMSSTTNTALDTYLKRTKTFENGEDTADDITVYRVSEDADIVVHVTDDNLNSVTKNGSGVSISTDGKSADVTIAASESEGPYEIIATDKAGNKTTRKIKIVDVTMNTTPTTIDLGAAQYGYVTAQNGDGNWVADPSTYKEQTDSVNGDKVKIVGLKVKLGGTYTENSATQNLGVKLDVNKVTITPGKDSAGAFEAWAGEGTESDTIYVRPKASDSSGKSLDVGEYTAILKVSYDFDIADADDHAVVIGQHSHSMGTSDATTLVVSDGLKFKVTPTPIYMAYGDKTEEYYHTRPGDGQGDADKQRWFDRLKIARGLRYGEAESVVKEGGTFVGSTYHPDYTVSAAPASGLTSDKYLIDDCSLSFAITGGSTKLASKNYYYASTDTQYTVTGNVTVNRRDNNVAGTVFAKGTAYTIVGDQVADRPDSRDWYTSNVTIKPIAGYKVRDAGEGSYDAKVDQEDDTGKTEYNVEASDAWSTVDGAFVFAESAPLTDESDNQLGKVKYFYLIKEDTGEVSGLIKEVVLIDKTAPGEKWDPSANAGAGGPAVKPDDEIPYFYIELNAWRKFLSAITFDLFFNDTMKITLGNADDKVVNGKYYGDYQSKILGREFVISDKACADPTALISHMASEGLSWRDLSNPNITEDEKNGYIYVKLTNGAGLSSYYSTQGQMVIFDSKGPVIEADYEGQDQVAMHEFEDSTEFIAEKVNFRVTDNIGLFEGEHDQTGKLISDTKTVKIYAGKDTTTNPIDTFDFNSASPKEQKFTLDCHNPAGEPGYTIKAKDNSGFVTTRYVKIRKPVYGIKVKQVSLETKEYGYNTAPEQTIEWENDDSKRDRNADVRKIYYDKNDSDNAAFLEYFTAETKEWYDENGHKISSLVVKPRVRTTNGERLHFGSYTKILHVMYDDTDGLTTEKECKCVFRVSKKRLTATFKGKSVKLGEQVSIDPSTDIEVRGFITDETGAQEEGRETSADGKIKQAKGYTDPTVTVPSNVSSTVLVKPSGGKAFDYDWDYVDGVLQVGVEKAVKGTHYTVEPKSPNDMGWYTTDIKISPLKGYELTSDALGLVPYKNNILINEDNSNGIQKFYVKDTKTGQMFEQSTFAYRRDTVAPVITGVTDGLTYKANKRTVTVKDDNLSIVTVNGMRMPKATFDIVADQQKMIFFIVAQDQAGHITTSQVTLMQEDGREDGLEDDPYYNPDDDQIQDDTEGGTDNDLGEFKKYVQLVGDAPNTTFTSTNKELKNYVLNSSERTVIKEGSDANVKLRVQGIDGSVSQEDKQLVFAALGKDYTLARYLDVTLWKQVGSGEEQQVTSTKKSISMTFTIPSEFRKTKAGKVREFAFVRVHGNAAAVLEDEDASANTITVSSKLFSVYALAYRDVDASKAKNNNSSSGSGSGSSSGSGSYGSVRKKGVGVEMDGIIDGSPQTGDRAPIIPTALGFGLSFIGMITVLVLKKKLDYEWVYVDEAGNYYDKRGNYIDPDEIEEMD